MSRLIDADAIPESATAISTDGRLFVAWSEIVKAPTIDAVPVVRCRDCENWAGDPATKPEYAGCWRYGAVNSIIVHENGFCDKGKRRSGL